MTGANLIPEAAMAGALEAVKAYLRIDGGGEDVLLAGLALTATRLGEQFCAQLLIARPIDEIVPASGEWRRLAATPVRSISAVMGVPAEGAAFALPVDAYAIDIDANGDGWVRVSRPGTAGRVQVTLVAGVADGWDGLPEPIRQGVVRLVAHLHVHRDENDGAEPPTAVAALWRPWRRMRLR